MKKFLIIFFVFMLIFPTAYAYDGTTVTVNTTFKTTVIDDGALNIDGTLYLSLAEISEAMGAVVFENNEENVGYYIILRNGDVIKHSAWTFFYEMNGTIKYNPAISLNDGIHGILVPHTMIEGMFGVVLSYENDGIHISADMISNYYTEIISRVMSNCISCISSDFYPENFTRYYTYACYNPWLDASSVIKNVNIGLDKKYFDDATIISDTKSTNILVNKLNRLPQNFTPENLVSVYSMYVKDPGRNHYLNSEAYTKYIEMYDAAAKEGLYLKIVSSYRTEDYQRGLYNSYLKNNGFAHAEKYSARPGYSEHQTGLAVDINSLYASFENSKEYKWLNEHAHEYGFIERYQKGKEYITGYAYEPWHYRYVGIDAAKIIHEQNITFEEYYATYVYKSPYSLNSDRTKTNVLDYYHK